MAAKTWCEHSKEEYWEAMKQELTGVLIKHFWQCLAVLVDVLIAYKEIKEKRNQMATNWIFFNSRRNLRNSSRECGIQEMSNAH